MNRNEFGSRRIKGTLAKTSSFRSIKRVNVIPPCRGKTDPIPRYIPERGPGFDAGRFADVDQVDDFAEGDLTSARRKIVLSVRVE